MWVPLIGDDPTYTGMGIHSKIILCTTPDEDGKLVRMESAVSLLNLGLLEVDEEKLIGSYSLANQ